MSSRDLVRQKSALRELAESQAQMAELGRDIGSAFGNALEGFIFDGKKARDVLRDLAQDLARMAFRKTVTNNLEQLFGMATQAIGNALGGGGATPNLVGGVIPAMTGALVDQAGILQRGGRNYSVSEGGATTPEAIFPLERDARGRLGIAAGGGGGGDTIHMHFNGVRTAQDARAMRSTMAQQLRSLRAGDRRARRGRRPPGE